jgi:hypothetical protein
MMPEGSLMTDFEILSLFGEFGTNIQDAFVNYVGVLSAFIVASYLVANKLTTRMSVVLIGLFSVVALQQGAALLLYWGDQVGLLAEMRGRDTLSWHGAHRAPPSIGLVFYATYFVTVFGGYVGALVFFLDRRRRKEDS